ncbi:Phosphatidylinositolglycan class N-domain-containing protein [Cyathus striatus]|nr:Phosphatidylinositolglycan class N-domain-containing protein [Cyathus striatus]
MESTNPMPGRLPKAPLLLIGLVFHLVYIGSVFDCYFTSPVVTGMESYNTGKAPAKRLVLIVGDGLRADLLFNQNPFPSIPNSPKIVAPYLRSIVENRGAFGISHTRVPTESRPGHVAIIGGMYEDVSAVTKGWKTNPVDFDSVFNRSGTTYSFGSPDILPMFARGATPGRVKTWSYSEIDEDFTKDATELDVWVLDQLKSLLYNSTVDLQLRSELHSDKVVFFLHLLGLDTTGHAYRPHSKEYMRNIQVVDNIVKETEQLLSGFYNDNQTAFVFTADHGMSVIGNHGDGHPDNTRTPLITWGKGIRGPALDDTSSSHDAYSKRWDLSHLVRRDVEQADIASLMAALIGINWPVNSVGVLPDADPTKVGYLDPSEGEESIAQAAFVNAKVILEHYRVKHELKESHALFYTPFKPLDVSTSSTSPPPRLSKLTHIESLMAQQDWRSARQASLDLIQTALAGLHYLQTYDRLLIRAIVTVAYIGWAAYAALFVFRPLDYMSGLEGTAAMLVNGLAIASFAAFSGLFYVQKSPVTFYAYIFFPCFFWREVLVQGLPSIRSWLSRRHDYRSIATRTFIVFATLQCMVLGYTHRVVWSAGFLILGALWPLSWPSEMDKPEYDVVRFDWRVMCLINAIFPLLGVDKKESILAILSGGSAIHLAAVLYANRERDIRGNRPVQLFIIVQTIILVASMGVTCFSIAALSAKIGLPIGLQIAGWVLLVSSVLLPTIYPFHLKHTINSKLICYFLAFGPCFVVLAIREEGLFYTAFVAILVGWLHVERALRGIYSAQAVSSESRVRTGPTVDRNRLASATEIQAYQFQPDDLRIALFFLFFVQVAFFGIGNVASISSFYLAPVYRLIPVFSPFFMAALLIFKIVAPYVLLSVVFAVLNHTLELPPFSLLMVALTLTDGMTLTFFFNVQDTGSWLEIGQSITFFCISSMLLLWSAGVCALGEYLMSDMFKMKVKRS